MKIQVLYTKDSAREMRAKAEFDEGFPTAEEINDNYVVVYFNNSVIPPKTPDELFEIFNGMNETEPNPLTSLNGQRMVKMYNTHTSMSVGDIVKLNDSTYICLPDHWVDISTLI